MSSSEQVRKLVNPNLIAERYDLNEAFCASMKRWLSVHEFVACMRHTVIEAAEQALPTAGPAQAADARAIENRTFLRAGASCSRELVHAASIVPGHHAPGTRDIVVEAWRRAPLLHFGSP